MTIVGLPGFLSAGEVAESDQAADHSVGGLQRVNHQVPSRDLKKKPCKHLSLFCSCVATVVTFSDVFLKFICDINININKLIYGFCYKIERKEEIGQSCPGVQVLS